MDETLKMEKRMNLGIVKKNYARMSVKKSWLNIAKQKMNATLHHLLITNSKGG